MPPRDLFPRPPLQVRPAAASTEPRLWIRRLVIWREPGVVLRDIQFRKGLNIIWSPDSAQDGHGRAEHMRGPGHGAGKSLLCRFLRYCLGETVVAPEPQRQNIALAFVRGRVGIELMLDGTPWAVVRSIGMDTRDVVREGSTLDALDFEDGPSSGMAPLLDTLVERVLTPQVADLVDKNPKRAWLKALAWLTRDQECRFAKFTEWRAASADSRSPARSLNATEATEIVRALLRAITPDERALEIQIGDLAAKRADAVEESERKRWLLARATLRAARKLGLGRDAQLDQSPLLVELLRREATRRLAAVAVVGDDGEVASFEVLDARLKQAWDTASRIKQELALARAEAVAKQVLATRIANEIPGISASLDDAEFPTCPVCEVEIDRVLVQGCKLSHKIQNLVSIRERRESVERQLAVAKSEVADAEVKAEALQVELAPAIAAVEELSARVRAARKLSDARSEAWYEARRIKDDVDEVSSLMAETAELAGELEGLDRELETKRARVGAARDRHVQIFARLQELFDPIVRALVGEEANGTVALDGNGLHAKVNLGGERSTPAIESLKILVLDLAAMCLSIEGGAHIPALFVHDSPREADLDLGVYHRLFRLVVDLEHVGPAPLFQYFVTTTTRPPDDLCDLPWLRLTLGGAPAEERLLQCDL